jgi:hypothetical protein
MMPERMTIKSFADLSDREIHGWLEPKASNQRLVSAYFHPLYTHAFPFWPAVVAVCG